MSSLKELKQGFTFKVKFKGKIIEIDTSKELSINENIINSQLKESPSSYAFLCLIKNHYIKLREELEDEIKKAYSEAWLFYKNSDSRINNDTANNKAETNKKYISLKKQYLKVSEKTDNLIAITKAFEGRENILRTISAKLRKEQHD